MNVKCSQKILRILKRKNNESDRGKTFTVQEDGLWYWITLRLISRNGLAGSNLQLYCKSLDCTLFRRRFYYTIVDSNYLPSLQAEKTSAPTEQKTVAFSSTLDLFSFFFRAAILALKKLKQNLTTFSHTVWIIGQESAPVEERRLSFLVASSKLNRSAWVDTNVSQSFTARTSSGLPPRCRSPRKLLRSPILTWAGRREPGPWSGIHRSSTITGLEIDQQFGAGVQQ